MVCPVDWIQHFYEWYSSFFVYLNLSLCCIAVATNIINVTVFTRKRLKSATAFIIAATAVSDIGTVISYARMAWYTYLYEPGYPMEEYYTLHAAWERVLCRHFFVLFYNISIWLQVILAMWRCTAVFYPLQCRRLCNMRTTYWTVASCYAVSVVMFAPRFLSQITMQPVTEKTWPDIPLYRIGFVDDFMRSLHYMIQTWLFQFLPCVALTVFTIGLVWCLLKNEKIRNTMSAHTQTAAAPPPQQTNSDSSKRRNKKRKAFSDTEKTTQMLTVLLVIFWCIEALVGIVSFLRSFGGSHCYVYVIAFADTLRLANIAFKICIYYTMSVHYRITANKLFKSLFGCKSDDKDGTTTTTTNTTTTTTTPAETYSL